MQATIWRAKYGFGVRTCHLAFLVMIIASIVGRKGVSLREWEYRAPQDIKLCSFFNSWLDSRMARQQNSQNLFMLIS